MANCAPSSIGAISIARALDQCEQLLDREQCDLRFECIEPRAFGDDAREASLFGMRRQPVCVALDHGDIVEVVPREKASVALIVRRCEFDDERVRPDLAERERPLQEPRVVGEDHAAREQPLEVLGERAPALKGHQARAGSRAEPR